MGAVVIILSYLALFGFTLWQAVIVNDSVRYLHVWIDDFVTEPVARLPTNLFEGVKLNCKDIPFSHQFVHSVRNKFRFPVYLAEMVHSLTTGTRTTSTAERYDCESYTVFGDQTTSI